MNRVVSAFLTMAVCSSFLAANAASTKPASKAAIKPPPPDYFPLKQDYWWKYQTESSTGQSGYTMKVVAVEKKDDGTVIYDMHTEPASGGSYAFDEWYTKPKGWVHALRFRFGASADPVDYNPSRKYLENPLLVGHEWNWTGSKGKTEATEENKVEPAEDVDVPAGKFKAIKVTTKISQGGATVTKTYWYAPWVGLVQASTESGGVLSTNKLADYSFKKPEKLEKP
jgi:hypothetical protein